MVGGGGGQANSYFLLLDRGRGGLEKPKIVLHNKWTAPNKMHLELYAFWSQIISWHFQMLQKNTGPPPDMQFEALLLAQTEKQCAFFYLL